MTMIAAPTRLSVQIRAMVDGDLPDVWGIDRVTSPKHYWGRDEFKVSPATHRRMTVVATHREVIVGFASYTFAARSPVLTLEKLAVEPSVRRQGVGSELLLYVAGRVGLNACRGMAMLVPESAIGGCRFLAAHGLRSSLVPGAFGGEDGIRFVFRATVPAECVGI